MAPKNRPTTNNSLNLVIFSIPHSLLLQLGTGAALGGLVASRAATEALLAISAASEEVWRGDRLPLLPFPATSETESN